MLKPAQIGLWDQFGGSMPSGWTRYVLERFSYPYTVVTTGDLDQGNLKEKFDVIILVDGAIRAGGAGAQARRGGCGRRRRGE